MSLTAPMGLLLLRLATSQRLVDAPAEWLRLELAEQGLTYGYVAVFTTTLMVALGWVIGSDDDAAQARSTTDPLTGLANRRQLQGRLDLEADRSARYHTPLSLLFVDLDHLKTINDRLGHAAGDVALRMVAGALRRTCRNSDLPARWGGDEFAIVAPNTTAAEAMMLAERIRAVLRRLEDVDGAASVSVSIGICDGELAGRPRSDLLCAAADRALYLAKAGGRDRAVMAGPRPVGVGVASA